LLSLFRQIDEEERKVGKMKQIGIILFIILGLISPALGVFGVSPSPALEGLIFSVSPQKDSYSPGEKVTLNLTIKNTGTSFLTLRFSTSQVYDIQIVGPNSYFWRWSKDRFFAQVITEILLNPGEEKVFQEFWETNKDFSPGEYSISAWLLYMERKLEAKAVVTLTSRPSGNGVALVSDPAGCMIKIDITDIQVREKLEKMLTQGKELWVGGKVERDDSGNPPWHFRFDPDTIEVAEVTAEGLQAVYLKAIESDLEYWMKISPAYISGKVVAIFDSPPFKDIQENWAYPLILMLYSKGIINGFPDGNFYPERSLTRAEFIKILMEALNPPIPLIHVQYPTFSDLPFSHWASSYVENAVLLGWVKGFPDGTFRPDEPLTKEQVLTFIVRASAFQGETPEKPTFSDLPPDHWAFPFVEQAVEMGLIGVNDFLLTSSLFGTGLQATRSQVCLIMVRFLFF
jgi:hypothetical protein